MKEKAKVQERYEEEKAKKHRKKGEERGRKEGEEKAKFDMAKNLLQMGILTTEQIIQASGLSLSQVNALKTEIEKAQKTRARDGDDLPSSGDTPPQPLDKDRR